MKYSNTGKIQADKLKLSNLKEGNILLSVHGYRYVVAPKEIARKYLTIQDELITSSEFVFVRQYGWQSFENYPNFPKCDDEYFNIAYVYLYTSTFKTVKDLEQYFKNTVMQVD